MKRPFLTLVLTTMPAAALAAPPIGYAQATGYFKKESRPTQYQPLNLLDGREATAWCSSGADPLNDRLTFGFKGAARIDEIRIYTGNGADDAAFASFSRAKKISLKGPAGGQTFTVADQRGQQSIQLNPPLEGAQFTMELLDLYPAEDPEMPACISDVIFYSEGKPLNGPWLTQKLKFNRAQAALLGTWFAGSEGAPDRYLSFYFDGTYRFVYEPWDPEAKGKVFGGDYDARGSRMKLEIPGKPQSHVRLVRDPGEGKADHTLALDGAVPREMKVVFRDRM